MSDMGLSVALYLNAAVSQVNYYYWKRTTYHATYYKLASYFKNGGIRFS
jgi:hypothetical protein